MNILNVAVCALAFAITPNPCLYGQEIPADVLTRIMSNAAVDHPNDYSTQEYVVQQQTAAYAELASIASQMKGLEEQNILGKALRDYPDNYSTAVYVVKNELASLRRLSALAIALNPPLVSYPSPNDLISRLTELEMHEGMTWRKSRFQEGWKSRLRVYNGKNESKLSPSDASKTNEKLNQVSCHLTGPDQNSVSEMRFEIEVYEKSLETQTLKNGKEIIEAIFGPSKLSESFVAGKNAKRSDWSVELRTGHKRSGAYDIVATVRFDQFIQNPKAYFAGAKTAAKSLVLSHCYSTEKANFYFKATNVSYVKGTKFKVAGFVTDEDLTGTLFERRFECVVKIEDGNWQTSTFKWGAWRDLTN